MRLHRFFSAEKILQTIGSGNQNDTSDLITRTSATAQWRKVFRFGPGDRVIFFDGTGKDFLCEIKEYKDGNNNGEESTVFKILQIYDNAVKPIRNVSLFSAVVKKDTFEWIVEKATELGVSDITPVIAERSEKKNLNIPRLEKIVIEASEQSGRATVPAVGAVMNLEDVLVMIKKKKQSAIVFDPTGVKFSEKNFVIYPGANPQNNMAVFIGPEGGWSPDELTAFRKENIPVVSLGPQILRTETAAVAALSRLVF